MAVDPSVRVDLAVEYKGKKAFDQADKATQKLTNNVKKLAGAFGLAFSTRAVVNFAKESVKAFAADDAAIIVLRKNLQNLGLAYESTNAENFIASLEAQSAILDDKLRPAYAQLSKVTLSAIKTQELMTLAVDISRSTGVDFSTVINTLSRAYIGNYKGLKQLNIGLSDAELKTKDFAEIQAILIKQSQGAGKAYIETFAGSIDKLSVASANAKEIIGEGLVDLFADLAGNGDINKATDNITELATAVSTLLKDASELTLLDWISTFVTGSITLETFNRLNQRPGGGFTDSQNAARLAAEEKARKELAAALAKDKAARDAAILAEKKRRAKEKADAARRLADEKKFAAQKAILAKAESIFNIEQIQIEAALKGKISDNERLRLELQRAILNEDFELADKLQKKLEASQRATAALQGQLNAIKPAPNPFDEWIESLKEISAVLAKILGTPLTRDPGRPGGGILALEPDDLLTGPAVTEGTADPIPVEVVENPIVIPETNIPTDGMGTGPFYGKELPDYMRSSGNTTITVIVEGNVLDGDDFTAKVNDALLDANRTGMPQTPAGFLVK